MRFLAALSLVAFIFASCDSNRVFERHKDFNNRIWAVNDTAVFQFRITDTGKPYSIFYTVRNSIDYPYARLFVTYSLKDSVGNDVASKLTTAYLFDTKTGKPFGRSGLGDVYDHKNPLLERYEFSRPGLYSIHLQQFMRIDSLPGILAVGVRVETASPEAENK